MENKEEKVKKNHPWKGLKKSRNNQDFFGILFFLVMFYIVVLGSIIKAFKTIVAERSFEIATYPSIPFIGFVLIFIGILITLYLILIVFIGSFEIFAHNKLFSQETIKARNKLREIVFNSPWMIVVNSSILSLYLVVLSFIYFQKVYAIIIMFTLLIYFIWNFFLFIKKDSFKSIVYSYLIQWKHSFRNYCHLFLSLIVILILISSIFVIILCETSKYSIKLNKESYFIGEDAYITILPEGLTKPSTLNVTYSNKHLPLNYILHEDFRKAPVYIKIPSDLLKSEPYNSILIIEYELDYFKGVYRKDTQKFFIPVFNETKPS